MDIILLLVRLGLAAVLSTAALAKLFDQRGAERAFAEFGVPASMRKPMAKILPIVELAVAVALVFVSTSWYGAIGAATLLLVFLGGMFYQVAKGRAPDCHCFGQLHSEPVGKSSILRNFVFLAAAGFLVGQGSTYQGWSLIRTDQDILFMVAALTVIGLLGAIIFLLKRVADQQKDIAHRLELLELESIGEAPVERDGVKHPHEVLPIGAIFPEFELARADGGTATLGDFLTSKRPTLFFFISPTCEPCRLLLPEFVEWQEQLSDRANIVFVSRGTIEENLIKFGEEIKGRLLLQIDRELAEKAHARWTPTAILVNEKGRVVSHAAAGDTAIRDLVEKIQYEDLNRAHVNFALGNGHERRNKMGQKVPNFSLEDIRGREITSDYFKGKTTIVAFWGLDCGHCKSSLGPIHQWESTRVEGDPELVVFSDGDKQANEELGFRSPLIIDKGYKIAGKFGMFGTPSAVLVDKDGIIISETVMGAPGIWALLGREYSENK